ncbi:MAG: helix-hairpin-helix domain-containing protein [Candidatus Acidiferrales bacterium]
MRVCQTLRVVIFASLALLLVASTGCGSAQDQRQRDEKTRQAAADAAAKVKPALKEAGRALNETAKTAAEEAHAAAQGAREGWKRGSGQLLDLNSASESDLMELPGITRRDARRIIANRPYRDKHDLVTRRIITSDEYSSIRDQITATQ